MGSPRSCCLGQRHDFEIRLPWRIHQSINYADKSLCSLLVQNRCATDRSVCLSWWNSFAPSGYSSPLTCFSMFRTVWTFFFSSNAALQLHRLFCDSNGPVLARFVFQFCSICLSILCVSFFFRFGASSLSLVHPLLAWYLLSPRASERKCSRGVVVDQSINQSTNQSINQSAGASTIPSERHLHLWMFAARLSWQLFIIINYRHVIMFHHHHHHLS